MKTEEGEREEEASVETIHDRIDEGSVSQEELKALREMIANMRSGGFFEALTVEFSEKIREIAQELINFRKDIEKKIEPEIVLMALKDIPEASNQLEGINDTLEKSTMKIMDISEAQMEIANRQHAMLQSFLSQSGNGTELSAKARRVMEEQMESMKRLGDLSLNMMEPLSFQDLVGQRINRIIRLVKSIEVRIEDLIISFGIKVQKHREDPNRSFEDLKREVEYYKLELKGPQRDGEGLNQKDIDDLLASV